MALFQHIVDLKRAAMARLSDKRKAERFPIGAGFTLQVTITLPDIDTTGARGGGSKPGDGSRDWSGVPVNVSAAGLSVQLPPAAATQRGQWTQVTLMLDGHKIQFPGTVAHFRVQAASAICGIKLDTSEDAQRQAYQQLVEIIALASTFEETKRVTGAKARPGRKIEQYKSDRDAVLTVWRDTATSKVDSFELVVSGHFVRGVIGRPDLEIFASKKESEKTTWSTPAFGAAGIEDPEVRQLYRWVTFNLPKTMPADLRDAMRFFTAGRGDWKSPVKK